MDSGKGLKPWDMAAGMLLVEEAGGRQTDYNGAPARLDGRQLVASNGRIHDEMLGVIRAVPENAQNKR